MRYDDRARSAAAAPFVTVDFPSAYVPTHDYKFICDSFRLAFRTLNSTLPADRSIMSAAFGYLAFAQAVYPVCILYC